MKKTIFRTGAVCALLWGAVCAFPAGFESVSVKNADSLSAEQEFRRGVQAYYRGSFNDAILLFEKALSYLPSENLILDWLGKAYYRAGMEGTALQQWQFALDAGYGGLLLANKIEIVRDRRVTGIPEISSLKYTEAGSFPGSYGDTLLFSKPVSVLPNPDGTSWVLAYGSNELLRLDVNGTIISRSRGPLVGFDRPMDIVRQRDGTLLVCESAGDRVSVLDENGNFIKSFGSKGIGVGQFVGPQYLAVDDAGNVYVSDFGNARVDVFDAGGTGLFHFGTKSADFAGFKAPAGIAVSDGVVYVADAGTGGVYSFDRSGNYLGIAVPEKTFVRPEALKFSGPYLLVCDSNRICSIDLVTGAVFENARTGNSPSRVTCAGSDRNGNVLVADFTANEIYVMSKMTELVGGLFVQIERVVSDAFPNVTLEVKVENRSRQPVVGLKAENFYITENKRPVLNQKLEGAASNNDTCDVTVLIDRSYDTSSYAEALQTAVTDIAAAMNGRGTLRLVSAGSIPAVEYGGSPARLGQFTPEALQVKPSASVATDLAIRLAANDLINAEKKRAIVYVTGASAVTASAFDRYGLTDLTSFLNNNSISFYTVNLSQQALPPEIAFITESTNGDERYVYRPEGLAGIVRDLLELPNGMYRLSYTSSLPTNFGREYLPVELESYLLNRSGRDETGYFAPLQ